MELILVAVVAVALLFDFTNGFHDSANSIATSVTTRAISPRLAVLGAAILNFVGAFLSIEVAATVANGIVISEAVTLEVVLAGLIGAIAWNLITWYYGLPSSSSHSLIGGVLGAAVSAGGMGAIQWGGLSEKVLAPSLLAPLLAIPAAGAITLAILWTVRRRAPGKVNGLFRKLQLVSAGFVSLTHGTNDAQKTMGIIALALVASGHIDPENFYVPTWVVVSAATAMALGTYCGGWRIIRTLGTRVTKLDPPQGFAAETATASILWTTAHLGLPVSTTHTISSAILGAGASTRFSSVRWTVAKNIALAWVVTIPCAALVGASMELVTRAPGGAAIAFALTAAISGLALLASRSRSGTRRLTRPTWSPPAAPPDPHGVLPAKAAGV